MKLNVQYAGLTYLVLTENSQLILDIFIVNHNSC